MNKLQVPALLPSGLSTVPFAELEAATENFNPNRIIGRGGFGAVYRGEWNGRSVAVKKCDSDAAQGAREARREMRVLAHYRHRALVPLLGVCLPDSGGPASEICLIYPLMPGGALDDALLGDSPPPAARRLRIAADAAAGLEYLHRPGGALAQVLHRDVKSSNILLDAELNARVADVGLARPQTGSRMTAGVGTFAYMDPAYLAAGRLGPLSALSQPRDTCRAW
jgi:serine/threonine protein kinase